MKLTPFESTMLEGWEAVHKKSQLSLWILLAIRRGEGFADRIQVFIRTHADLSPEEQSLYRSLRRLESSTLIESRRIPNSAGPDKKQFVLTEAGNHVLDTFIERNITRIIIDNHKKGLFQ